MRTVVALPWWLALPYAVLYGTVWLMIGMVFVVVWLIVLLVQVVTPFGQKR